jgi:hypothetical protein
MDSNLAMWSLIIGFINPVVIALIQQPTWTPKIRAVVAFIFSALVAIPTAYFTGDLEGKSYVTAALLIAVSAMTSYKSFWRPTGVAPTLEVATSTSKGVAA